MNFLRTYLRRRRIKWLRINIPYHETMEHGFYYPSDTIKQKAYVAKLRAELDILLEEEK